MVTYSSSSMGSGAQTFRFKTAVMGSTGARATTASHMNEANRYSPQRVSLSASVTDSDLSGCD